MLKKIIVFTIFLNWVLSISVKSENIHPYNKILIKLYPRPFKLKFPDVPRITAQEAFYLYKTNKAFFIHIGAGFGNIPGALRLQEKQVLKLDPNKLIKLIPSNKLIILYCH